MIRVLIADDHGVIRDGLGRLIATEMLPIQASSKQRQRSRG